MRLGQKSGICLHWTVAPPMLSLILSLLKHRSLWPRNDLSKCVYTRVSVPFIELSQYTSISIMQSAVFTTIILCCLFYFILWSFHGIIFFSHVKKPDFFLLIIVLPLNWQSVTISLRSCLSTHLNSADDQWLQHTFSTFPELIHFSNLSSA